MRMSLSMPWRRSRDIAPFIVYLSTRWGKLSTSRSDRFTLRNKPRTHCIRGWTGPSVGLDVLKKRRISENYSEGFQRLYEMSELMFVCCDCCCCFCFCCCCCCWCCCSCRCYFLLIDPPGFVVQMATNMELWCDYPGPDNAQVLPIQQFQNKF